MLIAGTYTPFTLVTLRASGRGWLLFAIVWGAAVAGVATEAFWTYRPRWLSVVIYLLMGWVIVFSFGPLRASLAPAGVWLLVAGGLTYSLGTIFYVLKRVPYLHAVWHGWVLGGSVCHWVCITFYVIPWN